MNENEIIEKKSLRLVEGVKADFQALAKECVCLANARGGLILIGIEDDSDDAPMDQVINNNLPQIISKRISELTVNVGVSCQLQNSAQGGAYIELTVHPSIATVASTSDGRYFMRIADTCQPVLPDSLTRLFADKPAFVWEVQSTQKVHKSALDPAKLENFVNDVKSSERVSDFVKQKSFDDLLEYYMMTDQEWMTNLGVLWVGQRKDRAKMLYAPQAQFLKYDENGNRIGKRLWDDFTLNPKELLEAMWNDISEWKEGVEVADGLFRKHISNYDESVVREVLANALVHRSYTTRGDIFINLFPDRLEVHNPGLLPIGVTPSNILHKSVRRNEHLAKIFYDLKLMEREGSGVDRIYEVLLANGKPLPTIVEGDDRVIVTIHKRILRTEVVELMSKAGSEYQLSQRETICLGIIAQNNTLSAIEFAKVLNLQGQETMRDWLGKLIDVGLISTKGKTKGLEYYINPSFKHRSNYRGRTDLKSIEDHRLRELIRQDVEAYPMSSVSEIRQRIGEEIPVLKTKKMLYSMVSEGALSKHGERKWTRYSIKLSR